MADINDLPSYLRARIVKEKKTTWPIRKISLKKQARQDEEKKLCSAEGDTFLEQWFKNCRLFMTGICQCGCGEPSQKNDNKFFRGSAAHIFPKCDFPSIMYHPLNWVERRLWAGLTGTNACHDEMDDITKMRQWPNFADWEDIKAKFFVLDPLLTEEEKKKDFYIMLAKLVSEN